MCLFTTYPILFGIILFWVNDATGQTPITQPRDVAVSEGMNVVFNFSATEQDVNIQKIEWYAYNREFPAVTGRRLFSTISGSQNPPPGYEVFPATNGEYNLRINSVERNKHPGRYAASFYTAQVNFEAQLIVMDDLVCIKSTETARVGQEVAFTCSITYYSNTTPTTQREPMVTWYRNGQDKGGILTPADNMPNNGRRRQRIYSITSTAEDDDARFECRVYFEPKTSGDFPPTYIDVCQQRLYVYHAVDKIEIDPSPVEGDGYIDVSINTYINCTANGRPESTVYWSRPNDVDRQPSQTTFAQLEVTSNHTGFQEWICHASNYVDSANYFVNKTIRFNTGNSSDITSMSTSTTTPLPTTSPGTTLFPPKIMLPPRIIMPLMGYADVTHDNGLSQSCAQAYTLAFTMNSQTMTCNVNALLAQGNLCQAGSKLGLIWKNATIAVTSLFMTTLHIGLEMLGDNDIRNADINACANAVLNHMCDLNNWPQPVLPVIDPCPVLDINPFNLVDDGMAWCSPEELGK